MIITTIRKSALLLRIGRSRWVHRYIRPTFAHQVMRAWWAEERTTPPPNEVKLAAILYLADLIGAKMLVETGSYHGNTVRALRGRFDVLASIEIAQELAAPLQEEFRHDKSVRIILGDSGKELSRLLDEVNLPTIFWLDAHYSGGPTLGDGYVPIYAELDAIARLANESHAILIDDVKDFDGEDGYPTADKVVERLRAADYRVSIVNNMIHALPEAL